METVILLWKHAIGHPITSSPYVDENSQLIANISHLPERLICICDCSGGIYVLKVNSNASEGSKQDRKDDIFSSPVMIGGKIFVTFMLNELNPTNELEPIIVCC